MGRNQKHSTFNSVCFKNVGASSAELKYFWGPGASHKSPASKKQWGVRRGNQMRRIINYGTMHQDKKNLIEIHVIAKSQISLKWNLTLCNDRMFGRKRSLFVLPVSYREQYVLVENPFLNLLLALFDLFDLPRWPRCSNSRVKMATHLLTETLSRCQ